MTRAFVLGAGLGTRLKSLVDRCPKPLIPIYGQPLITFAFAQLAAAGIRELVVNTHHCHEAYDAAFPSPDYAGARLTFEFEPVLLETAGGMKNVERYLGGQPFIVYNGDILTDIPPARLIAHHKASGNEVTMVLRSKGEPLHVALDNGRVVDIAGRLGVTGVPSYLFTGIYAVEPAFLNRIPAHTKLSVIPLFMEMIKQGAKLGGMVFDEGSWWDLGSREKYLDVHAALAPRHANGRFVHPTARVAPDARITGFLSAGEDVVIESGAHLTDCVLWEGARVSAGSRLNRCVVTAGRTAAGSHTDIDF